MKWDSKYGMCYPGWHIECSAMSNKYLGEKFDIHTGGVDHIPIHHENEIAQAKGYSGHNPANYWMHVEFLLIDNGKMSKSLGNVYTVDDLEKRGIEPLAYRYLFYTSHYRNKLNFTWDGIKAANTSLNNLRELTHLHKASTEKIEKAEIEALEKRFSDAINDDLNMSVALSVVWEVAKNKKFSRDYYELIMKFDSVLSLDLDKKVEAKELELPKEVKEILDERQKARNEKDFAKSDELRDKLKEMGYVVRDSKEGQKIERA